MINFNGIQKKEKIKDLVPFEENPRQLTEKQAKDLEASLGKFNLVEIPAIWVKNTLVLGHGDYHFQHEALIYGWERGGKHMFYGVRDKTTVWHIDKPSKNSDHTTMKPVALCEEAIQNSSLRNELVLDLFGGAGSTLIACEKLGRRCNMMEIDPLYVQVIIDRWEKFTDNRVVKADG